MNEIKTRIERFETLPSTNDYAKAQKDKGENLVVIAAQQSGGRGTKGRSFSSQKGGVYLTKLTFYEDFLAKDAFKIMQGAAVAVCETLAEYGLNPKIKWPNDVFVNGKKICGILIENTFQGRFLQDSVVGVGLNVNNVLEDALKEIATTMSLELGKSLSVADVEKKLLSHLFNADLAEKYAEYLGFINETVTLLRGEERIAAKLLAVDESGNLIAEVNGIKEKYASAEITLRKE